MIEQFNKINEIKEFALSGIKNSSKNAESPDTVRYEKHFYQGQAYAFKQVLNAIDKILKDFHKELVK